MATIKAETSTVPTHRARHITTSLLAALVLLAGFTHGATAHAANSPVYPISGFFIYGSTIDSVNMQKLADIKAIGGDTVITFGSRIKPATLDTVPADCKVAGVNCAQTATVGVKVNRYFTYSDASIWGKPSLACPRDTSLTGNGKPFTVFVLPTQGTSCESPNGVYDVVVVSGATSGTAGLNVSVATTASSQGIRYYAGLPLPVNRVDLPYLPDMSYQSAFTQFTDRFLKYQAAVIDLPGLAGFYHAFEMPLSDGATFDSILTLYRIQNQAIVRILPGRGAIVSPYIDARLSAGGKVTLDQVRRAVKKIALTASGVPFSIAIQDGMGTGKGGAYFGNEASMAVDPYAAAIVGTGTWGSKYLAPNRDYFLAAAEGLEGTGAELWANLEGMAPATGHNPCDNATRGQTTKARIDRQLQQMANAPTKVISFMWDTYFTCSGAWSPLKERVKAGSTTPIITDSTFRASAGTVQITGFNLGGGTAQVRWTTANGTLMDKTVAPTSYNPLYGKQRDLNPKLESITIRVGSTSLGAGKYYMINIVNAWGAKNDAFYSQRG